MTATPPAYSEARVKPSAARLLWLFPPVLLIHFFEEFGGVGVAHGINLSLPRFLLLGGFAVVSMAALVLIAVRLGFPAFVQLCLGTVFLVNAVSHAVKTAVFAQYNAGVVTGLLLFAPLGLLSLYWLWGGMSRKRYFIAVGLGLFIHAVVTLIAL